MKNKNEIYKIKNSKDTELCYKIKKLHEIQHTQKQQHENCENQNTLKFELNTIIMHVYIKWSHRKAYESWKRLKIRTENM